jgi:hypothetical protein
MYADISQSGSSQQSGAQLATNSTGSTETRPRNVAVTFCQYSGGAPLVATPSGGAGEIQYADGSGGLTSDANIVVSGGNVGIGTATPGAAKLHVSTNGSATTAMSSSGTLGISSTAPQINFNDTDHGDWAIHVNTNKLYFIREPWVTNDFVLDGAGNVGIGTSTPTTRLQIESTGINNHILLKSGTQNWGIFNDGSSMVVSNGAAGAYGTGVFIGNCGQSWNALSDRSLKSEVKTLSVLSRLKDYRAVSYVFNPSGRREIGVVAQELQPLFPELVSKSPNGLLGVSYDRLGAIALEGVKELKADNDNLRAQLKAANDNNAAAIEELRHEIRALKTGQ